MASQIIALGVFQTLFVPLLCALMLLIFDQEKSSGEEG